MADVIHPNPIGQIATGVLIGALISIVLFYFFSGAGFFITTLMFLWGIITILSAYAFLVTRFITLEVSERELIYKRGIFSLDRIHVPFRKITGLFMRQTLIERIFSLGTLEIDTAGGPFSEVAINSMPYEALKKIVRKIESETRKDEGPDDSGPEPIARPKKSKHSHTMYR